MKSSINGDTLANEARMRRSVFKEAFLLVEGDSDERLYGIFTNHKKCQIIICHGRENLFGACKILRHAGFAGTLAISDADFEHLEGRNPPVDCILFTDWHDAECMMLRGSALDRLISQFVSREKFEQWCNARSTDVRQLMLTQSSLIGYLLWHSTSNKVGLDFNNLEVKEFVDRATLQTNIEAFVQHVKNKSSRHELTNDQLITWLNQRKEMTTNLWQIVRGHDFVELIGYAFRFAWGNAPAHSVSFDRLEQCLRLAFPAKEFEATKLFEKIKLWEKENSPYRILSHPLERRAEV